MFALREGLRLVPRAIQAQENVQQCAFECIVFVVDGKGNISVPAVPHDVPEEECSPPSPQNGALERQRCNVRRLWDGIQEQGLHEQTQEVRPPRGEEDIVRSLRHEIRRRGNLQG